MKQEGQHQPQYSYNSGTVDNIDCPGLNNAIKWVTMAALDDGLARARGCPFEVEGITYGWRGAVELSLGHEHPQENCVPLDREVEQKLGMEYRNIDYSSEVGKMLHGFLGLDARQYDQFINKAFSSWGSLFLPFTEAPLSEEKELGDVLSKRDVGVLSTSPFKDSTPYKELKEIGDYHGIRNNSKEYKKLASISDKFRDADNDSDRDKYAKEFRDESIRLKRKWEDIIEWDGNLDSIGGAKPYEEKKNKDNKIKSWHSASTIEVHNFPHKIDQTDDR